MVSIKGYVTNNLGVAASNLEKQLPLIEKEFPEISKCYKGTINLLLTRPLIVLKSDHRTSPILWVSENDAGEIFDLVRIEFEMTKIKVHAWLYIAHWSPHRGKPWLYEVIAPYLQGIQSGNECMIHINRDYVSLSYDKSEAVYVI